MEDNLAYEYDEELMKVQEPISFTKEEIERIDRLLEESDEEQRQNGNKLYTHDEVWGEILGEEYYKSLHRV